VLRAIIRTVSLLVWAVNFFISDAQAFDNLDHTHFAIASPSGATGAAAAEEAYAERAAMVVRVENFIVALAEMRL
jgi:hypothetical protein